MVVVATGSGSWSALVKESGDSPLLPDYEGACTSNVTDVLIEDPDDPPDWFPEGLAGADQIVMLVLDGLGWEQMVERQHLLRGFTLMNAKPITTVAPTTTATALTSISTGKTPGEHGVIG
ncbi:MAG TPA: alkaline phosphatase family protein, partial [Microthrixaceae bacterium]|nr:alkaline phosphatase family protein [Microthrixaceae bacterium]